MESFSIISMITSILAINLVNSIDHRKDEFTRIKHYELINIDNMNINTNLFEFDAFGQHYIIKLAENTDITPSYVKHTNGIPRHENSKDYESYLSDKSCHYVGKVLNNDQDPLQRVSLSLCNNRGIRGEIVAFNQTINIRPSRYYLDIEFDSNNFHKFNDEHLIWRDTDFDSSNMPSFDTISIDSYIDNDNDAKKEEKLTTKHQRRLLAAKNQIELLVISDPAQTDYYKTTYGNNWYYQLYHDMADYINSMSSIYQSISWPSDIGSISVSFTELEVMHNFDFKYSELYPSFDDPSCTDYANDKCTIDGDDYLRKVNNYVHDYKDQTTFDTTQIISKYRGWGGLAFVGFVCKDYYNVGSISNYFSSGLVGVGTHELGHSLGANHDGAVGTSGEDCPAIGYIMGGNTINDFSECSKDAIQEYFSSNNYLQCLLNDPKDFKSNVEIKSFGGKCLDIHVDDLYLDGGKVQIWDCNKYTQQSWYYDIDSKEIINAGGKCLDVDYDDYHSNIDGALIQIWECNGWDNQKWIIDQDNHQIISNNGKCLDVHLPDLYSNGGKVQLWGCGTEENKLWWF